jgi:hypothetical protein
MQSVPRKVVDAAIFDYFERVCVSVEATKADLEQRVNAKRAEVAALLSDAESEARKARKAVERLDRDYTGGDIDAKTCQRCCQRSSPRRTRARRGLRSFG